MDHSPDDRPKKTATDEAPSGVDGLGTGFLRAHGRLFKAVVVLAVFAAAALLVVHLSAVFIPLGIALLIAYILEPVIGWFVTHGANRLLVVSGVYALFVAGVVAVGFTMGPMLVVQTRGLVDFVRQQIEEYAATPRGLANPVAGERAEDRNAGAPQKQSSSEPESGAETDSLESTASPKGAGSEEAAAPVGNAGGRRSFLGLAWQQIRTALTDIPDKLVRFGPAILSGAGAAARTTAQTVLVLFYAFFFMLHLPRIKRAAASWVPESRGDEIWSVLRDIDDAVASFFRGRLIVCLISAVVASVGLLLSGISYWLALGVASGFLGIVPVIGVLITLVPSLILGLVSSTPVYSTVGVLVTFAIVQWVIEPLVGSFVISKNVQLHPVTIVAALLGGGILFGLLGVVVAIPLVAILKILARRYLAPAVRDLLGTHASPQEAAR